MAIFFDSTIEFDEKCLGFDLGPIEGANVGWVPSYILRFAFLPQTIQAGRQAIANPLGKPPCSPLCIKCECECVLWSCF